MTAISLQFSSHIRRLDVQRDLLETADLIELCFGSQMDPDGHAYLRNIRRAARSNDHLRWLPGPNEQATYPLFGYVWEEDQRLIGNVSLIPILHANSWRYLIANVAVHPDYRGRGIGHELTRRALRHIREQGVKLACLQVRDSAPVAYHLYLSQGFQERARRTTWVCDPLKVIPKIQPDGGIKILPRPAQNWSSQAEWLQTLYPPEVNWNLLYNQHRLGPGLWQKFVNLATGALVRHWAAFRQGNLQGMLSWEPTHLYADNLWLAVPLDQEDDDAVLALLTTAREELSTIRPLSVNLPVGVATPALENAGFIQQNTLIWMEKYV